jgi:hypothetical protein
MKLCYRGVEYDYTPPALEVTESEILGRYRGRPQRFSYVRHVPFPQPVAAMKFRGNAYRTDSHGGMEPIKAPVAQAESPAYSSMAQARRRLLQEAASIHQDNIRRSLERRMEVARAQGNDMLLHQLENEMHQFA